MWCTKCGTELSNEIKFCFNCGNKINDLNENYSININKQNQAETIKNGQVYSDVDINSRYGNQSINTNYNMGQSLNTNNSVTDYGVNNDRYANNTNYSVNSNQYGNANYDTNTNQYSSNINYNTSANQHNSSTNYDINSKQYSNTNYDINTNHNASINQYNSINNYDMNSNQYNNNYDTNTNQYNSNTNYNASINQYNSTTNYDINNSQYNNTNQYNSNNDYNLNNNQYNSNTNYDTGMQNKSKNLDKYYTQIELIDIIKSELSIEYFEKTGNFYVNDRSEKSTIKFSHAMRHYFIQTVEFEIPCLLYDDTAFGSAKNGFILTNKAIHWRNFLEESRQINFRDIIEISSKKGEIAINGEKINITLAAKYHFEIERFIMKIVNLCDKK